MNAPVKSQGLQMALSVEPVALAEAGPSEANRTLTQPIVDALWESGLMHFMNPSEAGGHEPGFAELEAQTRDVAYKIWLAGVGAYGRAFEGVAEGAGVEWLGIQVTSAGIRVRVGRGATADTRVTAGFFQAL